MEMPLTFSELLKALRKKTGFTQQEFADKLGFSKVLIGMLESNMKEPSKKFISTLAGKLEIHSSALMPFLAFRKEETFENLSAIEKKLIEIGIKLQKKIINTNAKKIS